MQRDLYAYVVPSDRDQHGTAMGELGGMGERLTAFPVRVRRIECSLGLYTAPADAVHRVYR